GDKVEEGDLLAEIETDKATMEFESFYAGTLLKIGAQEGESAPVDSLLAIIGPEGTDGSGLDLSAKPKTASDTSQKTTSKKEEEDKKEEDSSTKEKSGKEEQDSGIRRNDTSEGRIFASPLAKKMAEEKGIDLSDVKGSGDNGR